MSYEATPFMRENREKKFELYAKSLDDVVSEFEIDALETLYVMQNGDKIIYDEINDVFTTYMSSMFEGPIDILPMNVWTKEFSRKLKRTLLIRHMNQGELAARIGVGQATISNYIKGRSIPSSYTVRAMEKVLKLETGYLSNFDYLL